MRATSSAYSATSYLLEDKESLGVKWQQLEAAASNRFFLSWQWMRVWLECFQRPVRVVEVYSDGNQLVGVGLLLQQQAKRHGILSSQCLHLHQTGKASSDQIWVEYNGFLTATEHREPAEQAALAYIRDELCWDEWIIGAIESEKAEQYNQTLGTKSHLLWEAPCYGVDLKLLRQQSLNYREALTANTRYQINRSLRIYQQRGTVELARPQSKEEALAWFEGIAPLHLKRWGEGMNQSGFANPEFTHFHKTLLMACWGENVDLVALKVDGVVIATFYNFSYRNRVYFYLAGLKVETDNKLKPGLVGHTLCIEDYMARGYDFYDFMGGDEQYKAQLGSQHNHLVQVALQRRQFKFLLEQQLRQVKRQLVKAFDGQEQRKSK